MKFQESKDLKRAREEGDLQSLYRLTLHSLIYLDKPKRNKTSELLATYALSALKVFFLYFLRKI